ncbi:MAG: trypsin-like peptidase domain-containing protein, partial [Rhodobacteraceae bacterium]|nr:trypsin-like peptidase domain-containing protein [Paracoccaceae bacterium]
MSDRAIAKTGLGGYRLLTDARGTPALTALPALQRHGVLFARPDVTADPATGEVLVTWYHGALGEARPLHTLSPAARARVEDRLREALVPIVQDLDDPIRGPLLGRALHLANADAIWAVGDTPVLIEWGMVPNDVGLDVQARAVLYDQSLGRFAPLTGAPPIGDAGLTGGAALLEPTATRGGAAKTAGLAASAQVAGGGVLPPGSDGDAGAPVFIRPMMHWFYWVPLMVLIVLMLLAILWLLLPGNRVFPAPPDTAEEEALLEAENQALLERIERLRAAEQNAVCRPDGFLELPNGRTPEGLVPPPIPADPDAPLPVPTQPLPGVPDAPVTPAPERVIPTQPEGTAEDATSLDALIEETTVMILAGTTNGGNLGSGFFIGPDLVMTNDHVIEGATQIYAIGASLGTVRQAELLATMGPFAATGGDFALLRLPGVQNRALSVRLPDSSLQLNNVYAAGFPGDVMDFNTQFQQLMSGQDSAVPDVFITTGVVNSEQDGIGGQRMILHSASISTGN